MGSMCARCIINGSCLVNYRGQACQSLRAKECPEVVPDNRDYIKDTDGVTTLAATLAQMVKALEPETNITREAIREYLLTKQPEDPN